MEDLWPVRTSERCEIAGKALQRAWAAELVAAGPNARLSSAYIAAWKRWYITPITWSLVWVCFGCLSSAVLMRTIILWFEGQGGHSSGFILGIVFALMASEICKSVCLGQMWYGSNMGALQMRAATRYIVFEKLTKMRASDVDVGNVVTIAMNDAQRMLEAGSFASHFVMGPAAALGVVIVLLNLVGVSVLAGVAAMLALIPLQRALAKAVGKFRNRTVPLTSERTGAMNEALNGIKLIKLYAWEGSFADAVGRLRAKELDMLFLAGCAHSVQGTFSFIGPALVTFVLFSVYAVIGPAPLTANQAFTTLALLNMLRYAFQSLPNAIKAFAEANVSAKRVQAFLQSPEVDPANAAISMSINQPSSDVVSEVSRLGIQCAPDDARAVVEALESSAILLHKAGFKWDKEPPK